MTDPAISAAQRAWDNDQLSCWPSQNAEAGAREMAKSVQEIHRPYEYYEYDDTNGVFKTDADGERILLGRVCAECSSDEFLELLGDCAWQESTLYEGEVEWPCETAKRVYPSEEL